MLVHQKPEELLGNKIDKQGKLVYNGPARKEVQ